MKTPRLKILGIEEQQKEFCRVNGYPCIVTGHEKKIGFAIETLGKLPVNGLRHEPEGDTSGWYIWCGEEYSIDSDFFSPLHVFHLNERCPEILKFLGLSPGYRFLVAGDHCDIWFDESLLQI